IPRPRNSFFCFRSEFFKSVKSQRLDQKVVSCSAADLWRKMDQIEREPYLAMAEAEKARHGVLYPEYRYTPRQKKTRGMFECYASPNVE
ncbi:high mobility group box domain-containing protein, partial [Mycena filopes]